MEYEILPKLQANAADVLELQLRPKNGLERAELLATSALGCNAAMALCLVAVLLGCSEEPKPKAVPIKQVIAQCELKARDRYNFRNDAEYADGMDYLKVCMLSLGYELDTNISECQSILEQLTSPYRRKLEEAKTDEEKKDAQEELYRQMGEAVINFIPTYPQCYKRL